MTALTDAQRKAASDMLAVLKAYPRPDGSFSNFTSYFDVVRAWREMRDAAIAAAEQAGIVDGPGFDSDRKAALILRDALDKSKEG